MVTDTGNGQVKSRSWRRYLTVVSWFLSDLLKTIWKQLFALLILAVIGIGARVASYSIPILYIKAQIADEPIHLWRLSIPADGAPYVVFLWGATALAFGLIAVMANHGFASLSFALAKRYAARSIGKTMAIIGHSHGFIMPEEIAEVRRDRLRGLLTRDVILMIRIVTMVNSMILPLLTLLTAIGIMAAISWKLTALIATLVLVYAGPFIANNRAISRAARRREIAARPFALAASDAVAASEWSRGNPSLNTALSRHFVSRGAVIEAVSAFRSNVLARTRAQLLTDVLYTMSVVILLMTGYSAGNHAVQWSFLLGFLLALHHCMSTFNQVAVSTTVFNRFWPKLNRFISFLRANERLVNSGPPSGAEGPEFRPQFRAPIPNSPLNAALKAGSQDIAASSPVLVVSSMRRCPGDQLCGLLFKNGPCAALSWYEPSAATLPRIPLLLLCGCSQLKELPPRYRDVFEKTGIWDEIAELVAQGRDAIDGNMLEACSPMLRFVLGILPGIGIRDPVLIIPHGNFSSLCVGDRNRFIAATRPATVIITCRSAPAALTDFKLAAVICEEGLLGMGDAEWCETNRTAIQEALNSRQNANEAAADDDNDEFD
jgi:hypothetical protein